LDHRTIDRPDTEFNDVEWGQAWCTARQQINSWIDAEYAVLYGLLSDETYTEIFRDIHTIIEAMPGLHPAFEYLFEAYDVGKDEQYEPMADLYRAIREYRHPQQTTPRSL